ncbi:MAG: hypothetical protein FWC40_03160 [Proteobacteria bacterium]|nr:hypothetical protein [Pseudomonadota bacterium]
MMGVRRRLGYVFGGVVLTLCCQSVLWAESLGHFEDWDFEMQKSLGLALAESGAWSQAEVYLSSVGPHSQDWNLQLTWAKVRLQLGDIPGAQAVIGVALVQHPNNPRVLFMASDIAADAHDAQNAVSYARRGLALQPHNVRGAQALGRLYYQQQDWGAVIETYERLLTYSLPTSEVLVRLSTAYEKQQALGKAEAYLLQNVEVHANRLMALMPLHRFYARTHQPEKARAIEREIERERASREGSRGLRALNPSWK